MFPIEVMQWRHKTFAYLATVARWPCWVAKTIHVEWHLYEFESGSSAMSTIYSSYFYQLEKATKQRYIEKLDKPISTSNTSECGDTTQTELWCYCRKAEEGKMIGCDNSKCPIEWFHLSCLHITRLPKGKWYCLECRSKTLKIIDQNHYSLFK